MIGLQRDVLLVAPAASFHHPPHHHNHAVDAAAALLSPVDHSIIPLLTAAPCLPEDPNGRSRLNLWQSQQPGPQSAPWGNAPQTSVIPGAIDPISSSSYLCKPVPVPVPVPVLDSAAAAGGILSGGAGAKGLTTTEVVVGVGDGGLPSFATCQDCGNKAKRDCIHRRCRTCCKSRGFACSTHVKSTWLPAAQRRERQVSSSAAAAPGGGGSSASTCSAKKPRLLSDGQTTATANTTSTTSNTATPPRSFDTAFSGHQDAELRRGLPEQVRAAAVFKCVRVTTIDDGEDEYAYQAMVKIGGHIFKGFLYDQGLARGGGDDATDIGIHSGGRHSRNAAIPNISDLHLGGGGSGRGRGDGGASDLFAAGLDGGLIGGTPYGNPIN